MMMTRSTQLCKGDSANYIAAFSLITDRSLSCMCIFNPCYSPCCYNQNLFKTNAPVLVLKLGYTLESTWKYKKF